MRKNIWRKSEHKFEGTTPKMIDSVDKFNSVSRAYLLVFFLSLNNSNKSESLPSVTMQKYMYIH